MGGISIVGGGEVVTTEEMGKEDRVGKSKLLDNGVYSGNQGSMCLVERGWVVHLRVATLDGRVLGDEE